MHTALVANRETFKYVGTHQHLDAWSNHAEVKMTPGKLVREPEDYDDGGSFTYVVISRPGERDLTRAIEQSMSRWGCSHEYDCCGCASTRARVVAKHGGRRGGRTRYYVLADVSFNY